jgi:hypothetical protein
MVTTQTIAYLIIRIFNLKQAVQKRVIIAVIHTHQNPIIPVMVAINSVNAPVTTVDHTVSINVYGNLA